MLLRAEGAVSGIRKGQGNMDTSGFEDEFAAIQAEVERRFQEESGAGSSGRFADDLIRANGQAEAQARGELEKTASDYAQSLKELRQLYHQNIALIEQLREMNMETPSSMRDTLREVADRLGMEQEGDQLTKEELRAGIISSVEESQRKIADLLQQSDEFNHKENVRVYRNIQAATAQELEKNRTILEGRLGALQEQVTGIVSRTDRLTSLAEKKEKPGILQILTLTAAILSAGTAVAALIFSLLK